MVGGGTAGGWEMWVTASQRHAGVLLGFELRKQEIQGVFLVLDFSCILA